MISISERHNNFTFVTVTDVGLRHSIDKVGNQDAVGFDINDDDFILAVADGVGTCINAAAGSQNAVNAACNVFKKSVCNGVMLEPYHFLEDIIDNWFSSIADKRINDFCTTLKVALKVKNRIILMSIGDGIIGATSGERYMISPVTQFDFANQTLCLNETTRPTDLWVSEMNINIADRYVIFACTDGVSNGIRDGQELNLIRELETSINANDLEKELKKLVMEMSEYTLDDRTLGVVKYER